MSVFDYIEKELDRIEVGYTSHDGTRLIMTIDDVRELIENLRMKLPPVQPEIIHCKDCRHNGSFDTDCPIDWNGKEYCSFAER